MTAQDRTARRFRRWLWLYPPAFRRQYADDMTACFMEKLSDAASAGVAPAVVWRRSLVDIIRTALAEWRHSSLAGPPTHARRPRAHRDPAISAMWSDVRYAMRSIRRQPGYAWFVALTLAVGIGASASAFSVVNGVLLQPLPYPDSDRLVSISGRFLPESGFEFETFPLSNPEYLDYRGAMTTLEDAGAVSTYATTVGLDSADPERVRAARVTPNLFWVLRQSPALGRGFSTTEGLPGAPPTVVLSDGYWKRQFGANPGVVGQTIRLNGVVTTVVGIMPPDFAFPDRRIQLWTPLVIDPAAPGGRSSHSISAIGRLAAGATMAELDAETSVLMAQWKVDYPAIHTGHFLYAVPALDRVVGDIGDILLPLLAATVILLVIVCANVSSVALARLETRQREMAVRTALGAGRWRLMRLTFTESLLLSSAGCLGGLALSAGTVRLLASMEGTSVPRLEDVTVDWRVLLFGMGLGLVSAIFVGLVPAWRSASRDAESALRQDDRTSSADRGRLRFRRALVAAEVALTVVLVIGAGLMLRSLTGLVSVDPGFTPDHVVLATVALPQSSYPEPAQVHAFFDDVLARVRTAPGVTRASLSNYVPFYFGNGFWDFTIEGRPPVARGEPALNAGVGAMRPGFLELMGIPLRKGRGFSDADRAGNEPVVIINDALEAKYFAGENPLGRRLRVAGDDQAPWARVIGVVGSVRDGQLENAPRPMYYFADLQAEETMGGIGRTMTVAMAVDGQPDSAITALRTIVREKDATLPVSSVQTLEDAVGDALVRRRFTTSLFGTFAAIGLLLGATGIYGVLAYIVAQRSREIGIRRALGASAGSVALAAGRQAIVPVVAGLTIGLAVAAGASRWIEGQLFGITGTDAGTYAMMIGGVCAVAAAACLIPLRRALRIDPAVALRS